MEQRGDGFRRIVLGCKTSASSSDYEIHRVLSIAPLHQISLDREDIIRNDLLVFNYPLVAAIVGENIFENASCLVSGRVLVGCV